MSIHADTKESAHLVNIRMAYLAVSRGRHDAQIYTNDKSELAQHLDRDVSHRIAIQAGHEREPDVVHEIAPSSWVTRPFRITVLHRNRQAMPQEKARVKQWVSS